MIPRTPDSTLFPYTTLFRSRRATATRAREVTAHAGEQLGGVARLHDVVVAADEEAGDAVVRVGPIRRCEDDRQRVPERVAELAADFVAIDIGERDLENHERRALALREGEPVGAARRAHGVEAGPREQLDRR